eukprot:Rmarinus@m.3205
MRAWFMDDKDDDQRLPHLRDENAYVSEEYLAKLGVLYWKVDTDNGVKLHENEKECDLIEGSLLKKIRDERDYKNYDVITCSKEKLPCYEEKLKMFFTEHIHEDEEIRCVLDGSGYFDIRSEKDDWVRIEVSKDDMIILPPGSYHRFTLDSNNYIRALRLFKDDPKWTPVNRPCDDNEYRKTYVADVLSQIGSKRAGESLDDSTDPKRSKAE